MSKHMGLQISSTTRAIKARSLGCCAAAVMMGAPMAASAISLQDFTIGAGARTDFTNTHTDQGGGSSNDFSLDSVRLYISGGILPEFKFTFNTDYEGSPPAGSNAVQVIDAIGRWEHSDQLNIWAGRFLPPSDRANLYGPYYANNFKVYEDGVQDGYPSTAVGRDNGAAYWGQFGILKVSAGLFDTPGTTGKGDVISAARLQLDFWDAEPGYYLSGTYYGDKNIFAIGVAGQTVADQHAYSADLLVEKKLGDAGTLSLESEFTRYDKLGGYGGFDGSYDDSNGYYVLVSYLFPQPVGIGKVQLLGKYGSAKFSDSPIAGDVSYRQGTTDLELNYIIKEYNCRLSLFYKDAELTKGLPDTRQVGIGLQVQI